jgi:hypothetical protein
MKECFICWFWEHASDLLPCAFTDPVEAQSQPASTVTFPEVEMNYFDSLAPVGDDSLTWMLESEEQSESRETDDLFRWQIARDQKAS